MSAFCTPNNGPNHSLRQHSHPAHWVLSLREFGFIGLKSLSSFVHVLLCLSVPPYV